MNIIRDEISQLVLTRSKEIVIMRIELVNKILKLNETYQQYTELINEFFNKYSKDEVHKSFSLNDLDSDDKLRYDEMNNKLISVQRMRRRTEKRIDQEMKRLNFSKEKVSMFVMYVLKLNY